jgi:hypothetical protein
MNSREGRFGAGRAAVQAHVLIMSLAFLSLASAGQALPIGAAAFGQPGGFADPTFQRIWERADMPVASGRVTRTWSWGNPLAGPTQERYREAPNDLRTVQYFDKARMEINNPTGNPNDPYFVTNGRLVVEMVSGQLQVGLNDLMYVGMSEGCVAGDCLGGVAGDNGTPSYADLLLVSSLTPDDDWSECRTATYEICHADELPAGATMPPLYLMPYGRVYTGAEEIARIPQGYIPAGESAVPVQAGAFIKETQHNIPDIFWRFLNAEATVFERGVYAQGKVVDWVSAFGFPITEPFWIVIRVGHERRLVMFQAFERRTLTYSPKNDVNWRVEMGNAGAQYLRWRNSASPVCSGRGVGHFAGLVDFWYAHGDVRRDIGCPSREVPFDRVDPNLRNIDLKVAMAYQPFERGSMLYVDRSVFRNDKEVREKVIYILFEDESFAQAVDTWAEGEPVSSGAQPPAGLLEPVRGFGKAWREGMGGSIRARLGWATAAEQGGEGRMIRFQFGEILWSPAPNKTIVFYGPEERGDFPVTNKDPQGWTLRYRVFDDPYKERR